jgi:hypothetical protein
MVAELHMPYPSANSTEELIPFWPPLFTRVVAEQSEFGYHQVILIHGTHCIVGMA